MSEHRPSGVRIADLLTTLSLAVDLGLGQPMGHVERSAVVAVRLARLNGCDADTCADLVLVCRMGWLGCIADSRDAAEWFGDDIGYRAGVYDHDLAPLPFLGYLLRHAGTGEPPVRRAARRTAVLLDRGRSVQESLRGHCQVTAAVAGRLGLGERVRTALGQIFARWDGKGLPTGLGGADIAETVRLWHVADVATVHHERAGAPAAVEVVRRRAGTQFDPALAEVFAANADELLAPAHTGADWEAAGPEVLRALSDRELDAALAVVGDWVDLKSPWFGGHSQGVADLAEAAAGHLGLPPEEVVLTRRAAQVHELGRTGVSNRIWDKEGRLTATERERVRLHSYYTERMFASGSHLAEVGRIAAMAHERLDGSGYHRGLDAASLPATARVLAAADAFHTKLERRPHREALLPEQAAEHLRGEVEAGRLDRSASDAVLAAAGQRRTGTARPGDLTEREVEVLTLLARGLTNRQIARNLGISPKTVGNHVEHVYSKAGVGTRAAATLYAMAQGLLTPHE